MDPWPPQHSDSSAFRTRVDRRWRLRSPNASGNRRDREIDIVTGGTGPAESVHEGLVEAINEVGIDIADRTPRAVSSEELAACDVVATMGCSTLDLTGVDTRDWALDDPDDADPERVRKIRGQVRRRVRDLFDEQCGGD